VSQSYAARYDNKAIDSILRILGTKKDSKQIYKAQKTTKTQESTILPPPTKKLILSIQFYYFK